METADEIQEGSSNLPPDVNCRIIREYGLTIWLCRWDPCDKAMNSVLINNGYSVLK
jgi:hypothetical protein